MTPEERERRWDTLVVHYGRARFLRDLAVLSNVVDLLGYFLSKRGAIVGDMDVFTWLACLSLLGLLVASWFMKRIEREADDLADKEMCG